MFKLYDVLVVILKVAKSTKLSVFIAPLDSIYSAVIEPSRKS